MFLFLIFASPSSTPLLQLILELGDITCIILHISLCSIGIKIKIRLTRCDIRYKCSDLRKYPTNKIRLTRFSYKGSKMWNSLPTESKLAPNLASFKTSLMHDACVGDLLLCWMLWSSFSFRQEKGGERSICDLRRD